MMRVLLRCSFETVRLEVGRDVCYTDWEENGFEDRCMIGNICGRGLS